MQSYDNSPRGAENFTESLKRALGASPPKIWSFEVLAIAQDCWTKTSFGLKRKQISRIFNFSCSCSLLKMPSSRRANAKVRKLVIVQTSVFLTVQILAFLGTIAFYLMATSKFYRDEITRYVLVNLYPEYRHVSLRNERAIEVNNSVFCVTLLVSFMPPPNWTFLVTKSFRELSTVQIFPAGYYLTAYTENNVTSIYYWIHPLLHD